MAQKKSTKWKSGLSKMFHIIKAYADDHEFFLEDFMGLAYNNKSSVKSALYFFVKQGLIYKIKTTDGITGYHKFPKINEVNFDAIDAMPTGKGIRPYTKHEGTKVDLPDYDIGDRMPKQGQTSLIPEDYIPGVPTLTKTPRQKKAKDTVGITEREANNILANLNLQEQYDVHDIIVASRDPMRRNSPEYKKLFKKFLDQHINDDQDMETNIDEFEGELLEQFYIR